MCDERGGAPDDVRVAQDPAVSQPGCRHEAGARPGFRDGNAVPPRNLGVIAIVDEQQGHRRPGNEPRHGDILLSKADIGKARRLLGYEPTLRLMDGLEQTMDWYMKNLARVEPV